METEKKGKSKFSFVISETHQHVQLLCVFNETAILLLNIRKIAVVLGKNKNMSPPPTLILFFAKSRQVIPFTLTVYEINHLAVHDK